MSGGETAIGLAGNVLSGAASLVALGGTAGIAASYIDLQNKTQNLSADPFVTYVSGTLETKTYEATEDWKKTGTFSATNTPISSGITCGAEFTLRVNIEVVSVYIPEPLFVTTGTRSFKFWKLNQQTTSYEPFSLTYEVSNSNSLSAGNYTYLLPEALVLTPGTYRYGVFTPANERYMAPGSVTNDFTYNQQVVANVSGVYALTPNQFIVPDTVVASYPLTGGFKYHLAVESALISERFVKTGGGSATEFLKSDGTVDSVTTSKIQNISAIEHSTTISGETTQVGLLSSTVTDSVTSGTFLANTQVPFNDYYGFTFTLTSRARLTHFYIPSALWTDSGTRRCFLGTVSSIGALMDLVTLSTNLGQEKRLNLTKSNLVGGKYLTQVPITLDLEVGNYYLAVDCPAGSPVFFRGSTPAFTYPSWITSVNGTYQNIPGAWPNISSPDYPLEASGAPCTGGLILQKYTEGTVKADRFMLTGGGSSANFLKSDGTVDSTVYATATSVTDALALKLNINDAQATYATQTAVTSGLAAKLNTTDAATTYQAFQTQTPYSVPYFTSNNKLSGAVRDFFLQTGPIQTLLNNPSVGGVYRLASGEWTESLICQGQNYTLCGAPCPLYAQTTQIVGNVQIGATSPGSIQTRVRLKDIKFIGGLTFVSNSTYQELRTHFDNCDFSGTITFPTTCATIAGGTQIYFTNCSFSGSNNPLCTIPNQSLYSIYFTRCTFNSQTITNNLTAGNFFRLIFSDCGTLPSLSIGNCVLNGLNGTAVTTNMSTGSLTLGGLSTNLLLANGGTLSTSTYPTITSGSFSTTFTGVTTGATTSLQTITYKKVFDGTNTIVTMRIPAFTVTIGTTAANFGVLCTSNAIPADITPSYGPFLPVCATFAGVVQTGWLQIYSGAPGTFGLLPNNRGACAANTVCGISQPSVVTYAL
jgi:hypothetical protein